MSPQLFKKQVMDLLWPADLPPRMNVWAVLDGARDASIFGAVDGSRLERCCLYGGELPWQLQLAAPYLVQLRKDHAFTDLLIRRGWGQAWGIFLRSDADMRNLRRHLRGFLRVRGPKEQRLLFRYYDPRILRVYLPTCLPEELDFLYGPVAQYIVEAKDPGTMLEYLFDGTQLSEKRISLEATLHA
jgi:hypothetical protein